MPLTNEEIQYFNDGIDILLKKAQSKNTARSYVQSHLSPKEVLDKLTTFIKKDFVASASATGLQTPGSIIALSNSDLAKIQSFVGYTPSPSSEDLSIPNEKPNMNLLESMKSMSTDISDMQNTDTIIALTLEAHNKSIDNLYQILNISNQAEATEIHEINAKADKALELLGTPPALEQVKTVTSCIFDGKSYKLGDVIAKSDPSSFGITTALLACLQWRKTKGDHYLTSTGDAKDCSVLLPPSKILAECMGALEFSIENIMD